MDTVTLMNVDTVGVFAYQLEELAEDHCEGVETLHLQPT